MCTVLCLCEALYLGTSGRCSETLSGIKYTDVTKGLLSFYFNFIFLFIYFYHTASSLACKEHILIQKYV